MENFCFSLLNLHHCNDLVTVIVLNLTYFKQSEKKEERKTTKKIDDERERKHPSNGRRSLFVSVRFLLRQKKEAASEAEIEINYFGVAR